MEETRRRSQQNLTHALSNKLVPPPPPLPYPSLGQNPDLQLAGPPWRVQVAARIRMLLARQLDTSGGKLHGARRLTYCWEQVVDLCVDVRSPVIIIPQVPRPHSAATDARRNYQPLAHTALALSMRKGCAQPCSVLLFLPFEPAAPAPACGLAVRMIASGNDLRRLLQSVTAGDGRDAVLVLQVCSPLIHLSN
jgi:hypothetical protein